MSETSTSLEQPVTNQALVILCQEYEKSPAVWVPKFPWYPPEIFDDIRTFNRYAGAHEEELIQAEIDFKRTTINASLNIPSDLSAYTAELLPIFDWLLNRLRWPVFSKTEAEAVRGIRDKTDYHEKVSFSPLNLRPFIETLPSEHRNKILAELPSLPWNFSTIETIIRKAATIDDHYPGGIIPFLNDLKRVGRPEFLEEDDETNTACVAQWTKTVIEKPVHFTALADDPENFEEFIATGVTLGGPKADHAAPYFKMDMYNPDIAADLKGTCEITCEDIYCEVQDAFNEAGVSRSYGNLSETAEKAFLKFWGDPNFPAYLAGFRTLLKTCLEIDTPVRKLHQYRNWEKAVEGYLFKLPEQFTPADPSKPLNRDPLPNIHFQNQAIAIAHSVFVRSLDRYFLPAYSIISVQAKKGETLDEALAACKFTPVYDDDGLITEIQRPETHAILEELYTILYAVRYTGFEYEEKPTTENLQACADQDAKFFAKLAELKTLDTAEVEHDIQSLLEEFTKSSAVEGAKLKAAQKAPTALWQSIVLPDPTSSPSHLPAIPNDPNPLNLPVLRSPRYHLSDWLQNVNPTTQVAVIGEAFRRALIQVATAARGPRLLTDSTIPLEEIQQDYGLLIREAIPEHIPAVEAWVKAEQIKDPGKMVIGTKVHTEAAMFEERVKFLLDIFEGFGLYSTPFSLDSQGKTLVAPPVPNALVHKLLFGMYDLFGLIKHTDPQFQICLAGRWTPETAAIFGSSILLSNFQTPDYIPGCFDSNQNSLTDSRLMAYDAGLCFRQFGVPYDLEAAIGRCDTMAQNDHTVLNRGRTLGTVCSHHDYEGPFKSLFEDYRDAFLIALSKAGGLDETIMESAWVAQHAKEGDTGQNHFEMVQKIKTAWKTNPALRAIVRNLINQLDAIFIEARDTIIKANPEEFARLGTF